jgi:hypothetical protein
MNSFPNLRVFEVQLTIGKNVIQNLGKYIHISIFLINQTHSASHFLNYCLTLLYMRVYMARCRDGIIRIFTFSHLVIIILQVNGTNLHRKCDAKCIYQITNDYSGARD